MRSLLEKLQIVPLNPGACTGPGGWIVEGKAWSGEAPEPAKWAITFDEKEEPPSGRAGLWGSPYSGTPIRFDDLIVTPIQP